MGYFSSILMHIAMNHQSYQFPHAERKERDRGVKQRRRGPERKKNRKNRKKAR